MPYHGGTRRTQMWTPPQIVSSSGPPLTPPVTSGLVLQLDANQGMSTTTDGVGISSWTDAIGGVSFTQAVSGSRPVYKTAIHNGLPIVRVASGQYLGSTTAITALSSLAEKTSIFIWLQGNTISNFGYAFSCIDTTLFKGFAVGVSGSSHADEYAGFWSVTGGIQAVAGGSGLTAWHEITFILDSTASRGFNAGIYMDGGTVLNTSGNSGYVDNTAYQSCVGAAGDIPTTNLFVGDIGEILVYNRTVTTGEQSSIEAYGRSKWGTP